MIEWVDMVFERAQPFEYKCHVRLLPGEETVSGPPSRSAGNQSTPQHPSTSPQLLMMSLPDNIVFLTTDLRGGSDGNIFCDNLSIDDIETSAIKQITTMHGRDISFIGVTRFHKS